MRVRLRVGEFVMQPMDGNPARWSILERAHAKNGECVLQPFWTDKPAMGQQPVKAKIDPDRAKNL